MQMEGLIMPRRGENIYKRKDGRYEGRYVIGKTFAGRKRFGYVYSRQYADVRKNLMLKKAEFEKKSAPTKGSYNGSVDECLHE